MTDAKAMDIETHKARLQTQGQQRNVAADFAKLAIQTLVAVSGGALVAILTFLGNLWTKDAAIAQAIASGMALATKLFVGALVASVFTSTLAYLSALSHAQQTGGWVKFRRIRWAAIGAGLISLVLIAWAAWIAANALSGALPTLQPNASASPHKDYEIRPQFSWDAPFDWYRQVPLYASGALQPFLSPPVWGTPAGATKTKPKEPPTTGTRRKEK